MKRRTLLQSLAAVVLVPVHRIRLLAQPRELTAESVTTLRAVATTVLPASLGPAKIDDAVAKFLAWTRGYREGIPLSPGYGHPRLRRSGPSPVPKYVAQLAALERAAHEKGGPWGTLDLETRRALLDDAFKDAGVTNLPYRPAGQHVVADLMAHYFRSSEANDVCYDALIQREVCRPIQITTKRPAPLDHRG
ncbi:MAG: hypothetical protein ACM3SQ_07450 [Betaproteobacteria bacterium]